VYFDPDLPICFTIYYTHDQLMKNLRLICAAAAVLLGLFRPAYSQCLNSSLTFDSLRFQGGAWEIYATACMGAGTDGVVKGGLADTRNFFFGFYASTGTFSMSNFFPPFIFGDTTLYYNNGGQFGPVPSAPFNGTVETLGFTGGAGTFTCVSNMVTCGRPHVDCTQYIFYVNEVPDSIRLFGAEANNSYAGNCYPEAQMRLIFGGLMPVEWGEFSATPAGGDVNLTWTTLQERGNRIFEVMHSSDGVHFSPVAEIPGAVNSRKGHTYSFTDRAVEAGMHYYRIDQYDFDGQRTSTSVREVRMGNLRPLAWLGSFPNPAVDQVTLQWESDGEQAIAVSVFDGNGRLVYQLQPSVQAGVVEVRLPVVDLASGIYQVRATAGSQVALGRFVK
jgi:hypothetical protein